jgi:hypothetical protein
LAPSKKGHEIWPRVLEFKESRWTVRGVTKEEESWSLFKENGESYELGIAISLRKARTIKSIVPVTYFTSFKSPTLDRTSLVLSLTVNFLVEKWPATSIWFSP